VHQGVTFLLCLRRRQALSLPFNLPLDRRHSLLLSYRAARFNQVTGRETNYDQQSDEQDQSAIS
jgi:hypothetical protein